MMDSETEEKESIKVNTWKKRFWLLVRKINCI